MSSWLSGEELDLLNKVFDDPEIVPKNRKGGLKLRNLSFFTSDTKAFQSIVNNLWILNNGEELTHAQYYNALRFSGLIDSDNNIDVFGQLIIKTLEENHEILNLIHKTSGLTPEENAMREKYRMQVELIIFLAVNYKYLYNRDAELTSYEVINNLTYFKLNVRDTINEPSSKDIELSKLLNFNNDDLFLVLQGINFQGFEIKKLLHLNEKISDFIQIYIEKYDSIKEAKTTSEDERKIFNSINYYSTQYQKDIRFRAKYAILSSILYEYIIQENIIYKEVFKGRNITELIEELDIQYIIDFYRNLVGIEVNNDNINFPIKFDSDLKSEFPKNLIYFGAPGTGKSFELEEARKELLLDKEDYERVTFHPEYSYGSFVGAYKPIPTLDKNGDETISYDYVPGPFMRMYVKAIENLNNDHEETKPFLLIIEEINRANTAAVFGDVFQLLDRKKGVSEYPIQTSEDVKKYLVKKLKGTPNHFREIKLPDNLFIWATMNSADQGVYALDTAFKRRWSFKYIDIDENEEKVQNLYIELGSGSNAREIEWNKLRVAINNYLTRNKVNEDKLLGPFFINVLELEEKKSSLLSGKRSINKVKFEEVFKNKVLMYLFEDAAKQRQGIFSGINDEDKRFSHIYKQFDQIGIEIFHEEIRNEVLGLNRR
ncbi:AAA family ATPase [Fundicoccus ignavus]|uniref:AAA domain-containing protein n=1 Tax=Fundicoccus ignavus TaxID=2664442 RepID=A0A844C1W2_9LACT|nr:AAA family ATPase [Fundicoccus ignavus]MRJ47112.1 AAA domain-containing protein [Fundicoccus ignavus]